jgi:hypothetical protein
MNTGGSAPSLTIPTKQIAGSRDMPVSDQFAFPLDEFYRREGAPLPQIDVIRGAEVPEPYRTLLVHDNDMTPTLEEFYGCDIHIEVWGRDRDADAYYREVVLRLDRDQQPVEFGANRIDLSLLEPEVRRLVLDEYVPLGHILKMKAVPHSGHPTAFLRVAADDLMKRAFGLSGRHTLYGRRNTLWNPQRQALSQIVEILPPLLRAV